MAYRPDYESAEYKAGFEDGEYAATTAIALARAKERHFCERCGKRLMSALGPVSIHTCTPPHQLGYPDTLDVMSTLRPRTFDDYGNKLPSCPPCNNHCDQGRNCPANKQ